ncbi:MAG: Cd(II)/Pb(II)-responsive transcriptional regulator [Variovorax sp.]|jgi:Cd(II)/Pb(II)-responsive transcriptional regulator|uniref:Cd(II)/Pb(II)-responsive transcriptional regulator n=1 Tax=Variovorax sp. PAMC 28711 TaxID=1795631 RepID=UPI00078B2096|nr:Cd(II)/Pb(II)-responsive transcriptional regulator [Variovorax sp. PAMC 28711]AMM24029.1 cd(ii)/pb(ii)-responsive transcriptional regulator [Variovorax sp. PAMC 28711]RZL95572.1 MAG: Cd(II)/Pb(II)-responsive transcriptional regulator [Variovorax sp.]
MKIGELAKATGTSVENIRFYEREALLPSPMRADNNYRSYGNEHIERLVFIRHCRSLDMALGEIRSLLRFKETPQENCEGVNELLDEHIGHVAERIRELKLLEKQLKTLRAQCAESSAAGCCGILKELSTEVAGSSENSVRKHVHGTH